MVITSNMTKDERNDALCTLTKAVLDPTYYKKIYILYKLLKNERKKINILFLHTV